MRQAFVGTLALTFGAVASFAAGFHIAPAHALGGLFRGERHLRPQAGWLLGILFVFACLAALIIVRDLRTFPGGWQAALTVRGQFFEGRNGLIWTMNLFRSAFLVWIAMQVVQGNRLTVPRTLLCAVLWAVTLGFDLLSGGRAELILRNALPVAMALSASGIVSKHSRRYIVLILLASVIVFVGQRSFVRDRFIYENYNPAAAFVDNLVHLPILVVGGDEGAAFDYFLATRQAVPSQLEHRGPASLAMIVEAPIPRALLPSKVERTGTILTRNIRPEYYARGGNIAFSGAADLYYGFGNKAVLLGFLLIGYLYGIATKCVRATVSEGRAAAWPLVYGFTAAAAFLSPIRSDLSELSLVAIRIGMIVFAYYLLTSQKTSRTG
jgi:hypothetical protein